MASLKPIFTFDFSHCWDQFIIKHAKEAVVLNIFLHQMGTLEEEESEDYDDDDGNKINSNLGLTIW